MGVIYIYTIMKTIYPPGYHDNGFVAILALGHMMYGHVIYMLEIAYIFYRCGVYMHSK